MRGVPTGTAVTDNKDSQLRCLKAVIEKNVLTSSDPSGLVPFPVVSSTNNLYTCTFISRGQKAQREPYQTVDHCQYNDGQYRRRGGANRCPMGVHERCGIVKCHT